MDVATVPQDPNTTINMLADVAKTTQADRFKLAITKIGQSGYQEAFVTFADAKVDQIAHPEEWLTRIGGGGTYYMKVYHVSDIAKQIGGSSIMVRIGGAPRRESIDTSIVNELDWRGPMEMTYPLPPRKTVNANGNGHVSPFIGIPGTGDHAGAFPGGGAVSPPRNGDQYTMGGGTTPSSYERERAQIDRERETLRQQTLEIEKSRHQAEMDAQRRSFELEMAKIRAEIAGARTPPTPTGPSETVLMMIEMQKQAQAQAERQAEAQRRADERFAQMLAENAKATSAQLAAAQEMNSKLMVQLLGKPAIDPIMERLLTQGNEAASTTVKVVQQMADASGSIVNMVVGALHAISELNAPEQEAGWIKGLREAVKAVVAMQGAGAGAGQPSPYVTVQPNPITAGPSTAPRPAALGDAPAGAPAGAPAPAGAQPAPTRAPTAFEQVIMAIRARQDPTKVATFVLQHKDDPSIQAALAAAGFNPLQAISPYLQDWFNADPQNMPYVHNLLTTLQKMYQEQEGEEEEKSDLE